MSDSLYSSSWYRVATLRPQLAAQARFHRHLYRGQLWYVLEDPASRRSHRLAPSAYRVIALMDAERTTQEIWDAVSAELGDDAPTQDETIGLLGMLHAADLLRCDVSPDTERVLRRGQRRSDAEWRGRWSNPLAVRVPLWDPDRWLVRMLPFVRPLFGRLGALLWCVVVGAALVQAGAHWQELSADAVSRLLAAENVALLGFVYPLVKAVHELGHAFAARVRGGEVHEIGILFLVLIPVPYVDASSSSAFPDKRDRMLVAAAGMGVEVFLAAVAFFVWLGAEPGLLRSIAYNVMWIGGVSTLVFNGNPLLRYDGYYVLSDAIEIPNLAGRSSRFLAHLTLRHGFGLADARSPATAPGEARWLASYAVAAFVYRLFVMLAIAFFLASQLLALGIALACCGIAIQVVVPIVRRLEFLLTSPRLGEQRARALLVTCGASACLALFLLAVPLPLSTRAEGVIWPPERALVRAGADGFVTRVLTPPESNVVSGQPLIQIRDPELEARVSVLHAELRALSARHYAERYNDRVRAQMTLKELETARARLALARERVGEIVVRSPGDGVFFSSAGDDLAGRYVHQGELLGYLVGKSIHKVRVAVPESEFPLVREDTTSVAVRLAGRASELIDASVLRAFPAASDRLPSRALGRAGGGQLAVDPTDPDGLRALENVFEVDLALHSAAGVREIGGRAHVRFRHRAEPIAFRLWRSLRRMIVQRIRV